MLRWSRGVVVLAMLVNLLATNQATAQKRLLRLDLQTRDPQTSQPRLRTEEVDSSKVAVVVVDPWNYHWCMTACERVSAMVPRWNRALESARKLGMPVLWAPSDVAGNYAGHPQRERALGVRLAPVPKAREMPPARFTAPIGRCMCGPGIHCVVNYGHDAMCPDLKIADDDLIASSTEEVSSLLRERGITHVIYMGLHTNMCLFGKPGALKYMVQAGMNCVLARDVNDAFTSYDPQSGFTPDQGTRQTDEDLERAGVPTINVRDEWRKAGVWDDEWMVETVRITPWGKPQRPHFFEGSTTITLSAPWLEGVEIRYTVDGSEPGPNSALYEKRLTLTETAELNAAAFRDGRRVTQPSSAWFVRLPARPPKPGVYLDELKEVVDPYAAIGPEYAAFLWPTKVGRSFEGQSLRIRSKTYQKGLGMRAPAGVRYELKPEYERFVALAGIADDLVDQAMGRNKVRHCSVVFRVFIDGAMAAESPVMRISQEPWRFDVKLPPGGRFLRIVCMDAGSLSPYDLGNWVDAGFVLKQDAAQPKRAASGQEPRHGWTTVSAPALGEAGAAWKVGTSSASITPEKPLWMAGYGGRDHPAEGKLHDLRVKVLALEAPDGHRAVVITSDVCGFSRVSYEAIVEGLKSRSQLDRGQIMLNCSHTHSGPALRESLQDYYPVDPPQRALNDQYTLELEKKIVEKVIEALSHLEPSTLWAGEGKATFAVNRRNNAEAEVPDRLQRGLPLNGPVDHRVPVLVVRRLDGSLRTVAFSYACHATTLSGYQWCGDYPGFAQIALENRHPGAMAMFHAGCGADQNPIPRRSVDLCQKYGQMLAAAVEEVLGKPMRPLTPRLRTAMESFDLGYERTMSRPELEDFVRKGGLYGRWARRMLRQLDEGKAFVQTHPYGVQAWKLGDGQLWIGLAGEAVVDYSLRFQAEYGPHTWVTAYNQDLVAYVPSRRVWKEGGYEGGFLGEYGHPAQRWRPDVEDRIAAAVQRVMDRIN